MKTRAAALFLFALAAGPAPGVRAEEPAAPPILLGIAGRPALPVVPFALVSGESATLRLLPSARDTGTTPRLFQLADALARPLDTPVAIATDPADPRALLVRFTAPDVRRPSRLGLRLGDAAPLLFTVLPAVPRPDHASLTDALETSRLRLLVCGASSELRAWLRAEKLAFEDEGVDAPELLPANALLLGAISEETWKRLTGPRASTGRLLAFVDSPALIPGVYSEPAVRRIKVTLPLLSALPSDPLARATLHTLLLHALSPSPLEQ